MWTIDYDATIKQVHDGRDTSEGNGETPEGGDQPSVLAGLAESDVHDDPEDEDDWVSMSFSHLENYMSYVGRRREHWRLCADRSDQQWSKLMLPDAYMAQTEAENANHGGLIGDLPLLIGLLALSVPEEEVEAMLSRVMLDPWRFSLSDPSKRSDGCESHLGYARPKFRADQVQGGTEEALLSLFTLTSSALRSKSSNNTNVAAEAQSYLSHKCCM